MANMARFELIYNFLMAGIDVASLVALNRTRTTKVWLLLGGAVGIIAISLAWILGPEPFAVARLLAYGLFGHGTFLFAGSAILLGRAARTPAILSALAAVVLVAIAVDAFWIEPGRLELTRIRLASPKLDRPLKIVVLADFQTDRFGAYEQEVLRRVAEEGADLVLLAGDYLQAPLLAEPELRSRVNGYLRQLGLCAPLGVFALQGNVDKPGWPELFDGLPVTIVRQTRSFRLGPLVLTCLSLADSGFPMLMVCNPRPEQYHVVIGHVPDYALGRIEADLLIGAHTHGGQVRLPGLGPVVRNTRLPRRWASGLSRLPGGAWLVVSRGTGMERENAPRLRFLCRPELVVLQLEPAARREPAPRAQ